MAYTHSPLAHTLVEEGYPVRSRGLVMQWLGPELKVWSKTDQAGLRLNRTAAHIWLRCDGQAKVGELVNRFQRRYREQAGVVAADIHQALADLQGRGLLNTLAEPQEVRPLVEVGFAGFGSDLLPEDNYFLWMLTHRFDVLLAAPEQGPPDLLFYRTPPKQPFDRHRVDRRKTFMVAVCADGRPPAFSECDFSFSADVVTGRFAEQHCHLPLWSFHLDWENYRKSATTFSDQALPAQCSPEQVCNRFHDALLRLLSGEPEASPGPSALTPDPGTATGPAATCVTHKRLTIGMSTYDDFDGVYFTIQSIRIYQPEVTADTELLILDNHPEGGCAQALRKLAENVPGCRYVPFTEVRGTASRDFIFREAQADYVLCVDSHVLPAPGSIARLIAFLDKHPDCRDLLQGPLVYDDLVRISTHFEPVWSAGMYGKWGTDDRGKAADNEPFEIGMQGLGMFACRKDSWLGLNPRFSGFGGEEGYLHEKFRQAGRRTLCLPFLRWTHRFLRPLGASYRNVWEDRIRNYHIGFQELGLDTSAIDEHFSSWLGAETYGRIRGDVYEELTNPFFYFDAIYYINLDSALERRQAIQERFAQLGIGHRVRRFSAVETPESHHIGCALSHRRIVERAKQQGLQNVLIFEDDAVFLDETLPALGRSVEELKRLPWQVFHLGGHKWQHRFPKAPGCRFLENPCTELTCSHAVAYHHSVYQKILDDLPDEKIAMRQWLSTYGGIDQYLRGIDGRYLASPVVSSQPPLLAQEDPASRDRFTI